MAGSRAVRSSSVAPNGETIYYLTPEFDRKASKPSEGRLDEFGLMRKYWFFANDEIRSRWSEAVDAAVAYRRAIVVSILVIVAAIAGIALAGGIGSLPRPAAAAGTAILPILLAFAVTPAGASLFAAAAGAVAAGVSRVLYAKRLHEAQELFRVLKQRGVVPSAAS